jgi:hypothetical protein
MIPSAKPRTDQVSKPSPVSPRHTPRTWDRDREIGAKANKSRQPLVHTVVLRKKQRVRFRNPQPSDAVRLGCIQRGSFRQLRQVTTVWPRALPACRRLPYPTRRLPPSFAANAIAIVSSIQSDRPLLPTGKGCPHFTDEGSDSAECCLALPSKPILRFVVSNVSRESPDRYTAVTNPNPAPTH